MAMTKLDTETKKWLDLVKLKPIAFGIEGGFDRLVDIHNEWIKFFCLPKKTLHYRPIEGRKMAQRNGNCLGHGKSIEGIDLHVKL